MGVVLKYIFHCNDSRRGTIPCTGCSYCAEGCPLKIAIPKLFALYNNDGTDYNTAVGEGSKASKCVACGQCERICPQHLPVISYLKDVAAKYEV